jgi:DNA (cytosine-5)-methyltransferase 1
MAHHRPPVFLLENVKNLGRHDGGKRFATIMKVLENELGYRVQYRIIDAKGIFPQHRERIFLVGFRYSTAFDFDVLEIPSPESGPRLGSSLHPKYGAEKIEEPYI